MKKHNIRVVEIKDVAEAIKEIEKIERDKNLIKEIGENAVFRVIKISDLDARAANLLKINASEIGAYACIEKDVLSFTASKTDVLIMGTLMDYEKLYHKLKGEAFGLFKIAKEIKDTLFAYESSDNLVKIGKKEFDFNRKTYVMGILNITPDSFSDGGEYFDVAEAVKKAKKMVEDGADIIDIGAESSRPGADEVSEEEELKRIIPVIKALVKELDIPLSIDTYKANVAKEALELGVEIINDVTGLKADSKMADVISDYDAYVVLMHMQGEFKTMQDNPRYEDVIADIISEFREIMKIAQIAGIKEEKIILDPGIGFGKKTEHNLEIIKRLKEFKTLGMPVLMGASRKSVVGDILQLPVEERLEGSLAIAAVSSINGASILRVHDVRETVRVLKMVDAIKNLEGED